MVAASARASSRESRIRARGFRVRAVGRGASVARSMPETPAPGRYRIAIHRAMGCYFAAVDDLPGCFARIPAVVDADWHPLNPPAHGRQAADARFLNPDPDPPFYPGKDPPSPPPPGD